MSGVIAAPDLIAAAAADLSSIGSTLGAAQTVAAASTRTVLPAAADEVSANIALLFSAHAEDYQDVAGQAAAFHRHFVDQLTTSAGAYGSTETASAAALQPTEAIAGSIPGAAAAVNPITALISAFNQIVNFLVNPIGFILNPFFNAMASLIVRALVVIISAVLSEGLSMAP